MHWGSNNLPGQGLYGLSAYRGAGNWLLVTFGMTELFAKDSEDLGVSDRGYARRQISASAVDLSGHRAV